MSTKKKVLLILIPLFLVSMIGFGAAATAKAVEFDEDGIIEEGEVINDDLFIANDTVEINGVINGDVFAGGSVVRVNGTVNGSLVTGAQSILVNGKISGSVYSGSSTMTLGSDAEIGRNMYYGGFNLTTNEGSYINRDLLIGGYQALLSGEVGRDVRAGVGALEINGVIGNDVFANVGGTEENQEPMYITGPPGVETIVPSGIRVSEDAVIGGSLTYRSSESQASAISISPPGGVIFEYDPRTSPETDPEEVSRVGSSTMVATWLIKRVRTFITLLLLGGLILWQLPGLLRKVSDKAEGEPLPSLGWGLVSILTVYLGAVLAIGLIIAGAIFLGVITLGELAKVILVIGFSSLGLVLAGFGLLVSYGSKIIVSYLVGKLILNWLAPKYEGGMIWPLVIGLLIYTFLRAIPLGLGLLVGLVVTLVGIGAIWLVIRDSGVSLRAGIEVTPAE
jgi:cytoskeletal protein CcmA (bactofilin family)